jgi:2-dehydropantoate 2-reductase
MKIAIIGAGGVGGYLGAKLIKSGQLDTTLIARGEHLRAIEANGLTILDEDDKFSISSRFITEDVEKNAPYDFVIFTTKAYGLQDACKSIKKSINDNTILMVTANGVGYKEKLKEFFPNNPICESCIYIFSNIQKPGVIKKYGGVFQLFIGSSEVPKEKLQEIVNIYNNAGLKTKISEQITLQCWRKYLFISSFATLTSYYNVSIGEIVQKQEHELRDILNEIISIANKKDIHLSHENLEQSVDQAKNNIPYDSTTSMQLDFANGKKTELEALTGYIVREGERLGVKVDTMKKLYNGLIEKVPAQKH